MIFTENIFSPEITFVMLMLMIIVMVNIVGNVNISCCHVLNLLNLLNYVAGYFHTRVIL